MILGILADLSTEKFFNLVVIYILSVIIAYRLMLGFALRNLFHVQLYIYMLLFMNLIGSLTNMNSEDIIDSASTVGIICVMEYSILLAIAIILVLKLPNGKVQIY